MQMHWWRCFRLHRSVGASWQQVTRGSTTDARGTFAWKQAENRWTIHFAVAGFASFAATASRPTLAETGVTGTRAEAGQWRQVSSQSDSLAPFLLGLGVPSFAVLFVDAILTDLDISCDGRLLRVTDKTFFGSNTTEVVLGEAEVEKATRTKRKRFMLSGFEHEGRLVVQCRLFQRGEGWFSQQMWMVRPDGMLEERMVLQRPGEADIVVTRMFRRLGQIKEPAAPNASTASGEASENISKVSSQVPLAFVACGALAMWAAW
eukprot:CAMPEP_0197681282 /NCGR_PEP_ID=MMETSP1338-20131121/94672_1 /TAXON_ID=43686 ORGANISM="Pelagodinium beii, Strain RCC1491" /NCGR_SAMPLE_ID=MMETSP1338 /ASSEMBLY_ACC=CAM_ASM_000754 /LENGTH=261 /DNA_ID=CAMNT_0043262601 /DNA_START=21 /DNA_END=803 /DNA_ORIENTATION=-